MTDPRIALADILSRNGIPFGPLVAEELAERGVLLVTLADLIRVLPHSLPEAEEEAAAIFAALKDV